MKVSTEIDNNFGYEKNYAAGRQYPFKAELICLNRTEIINGNYILINCLAISKLLPYRDKILVSRHLCSYEYPLPM